MATTTSNFSWPIPQSTDLVKDGATAIASLGSGIDTSMAELKGGTTGQVLSKTSNTDMDFTWVTQDDANAIQNSIVDAKGDLISATANDTPARLAVGTDGQYLSADSTAATGLKWVAAPSGFGTLTSYTPTWTGITIGNGTFSDVGYSTSGDLVWYYGQFKWGSTTTATGLFQLSLPVNGLGTVTNVDGRQPAQVFGAFCDASTGYIYPCALTLQNASPATKVNWQSLFTNGTLLQNQVQYIQNTVPVTQATDDVFHWNFFYRKA